MDSLSGAPKQSLTLEQAGQWTRRSREQSEHAVKGHCFSRQTLEQLLNQPGAAGIRFYYGRDEQNAPKLVAVATDADDQDILGGVASFRAMDEAAGSNVDTGTPCPPCCSTENPLNS